MPVLHHQREQELGERELRHRERLPEIARLGEHVRDSVVSRATCGGAGPGARVQDVRLSMR
ncbi:MAG: hypothetical protein AMXMBFR56_64070 [Polyangiaceae bacterium]